MEAHQYDEHAFARGAKGGYRPHPMCRNRMPLELTMRFATPGNKHEYHVLKKEIADSRPGPEPQYSPTSERTRPSRKACRTMRRQTRMIPWHDLVGQPLPQEGGAATEERMRVILVNELGVSGEGAAEACRTKAFERCNMLTPGASGHREPRAWYTSQSEQCSCTRRRPMLLKMLYRHLPSKHQKPKQQEWAQHHTPQERIIHHHPSKPLAGT